MGVECSVSSVYVSGVYFFFYIVEAVVVTIGNDRLAHLLELVHIVNDYTAEKGFAIP